MADITTIAPEATILVNSLAEANTSSEALPIVSTNTNNAVSSNVDENNTKGFWWLSVVADDSIGLQRNTRSVSVLHSPYASTSFAPSGSSHGRARWFERPA